MLEVIPSKRFKKEIKLAQKRGLDIKALQMIIEKLAKKQKLDDKYKNHFLHGKYEGYCECHIQPDWLLIYKIDQNELFLYLLRTGSHSDLFG